MTVCHCHQRNQIETAIDEGHVMSVDDSMRSIVLSVTNGYRHSPCTDFGEPIRPLAFIHHDLPETSDRPDQSSKYAH